MKFNEIHVSVTGRDESGKNISVLEWWSDKVEKIFVDTSCVPEMSSRIDSYSGPHIEERITISIRSTADEAVE